MNFFQRCCVFFAVTEILFITISLVTTLRDILLQGHTFFAYDPWNGYYWKLFFPVKIIIAIIALVSAVFLYKGAVNKNEKHFLPWIFVHGILSGLASICCVIVLFYPAVPSFGFMLVAIITSIFWAMWIITSKCRNSIKNEAMESQIGFNKLDVYDLILKV